MTPEQVEELKEKIKKMSPEELKEFQKKQCIFCHIVAGKVQAKKVYEDGKCLAILDINPANPGHILLLPKEHYSVMPQLPEEEIEHIFMVAKSLSNVALRTLEATGTNIIVANGPAAGQKAQHFMVHVIPRRENDGVEFTLPQKTISEKELNAIQEKISGRLSKPGLKREAVAKQPQIILPKARPDIEKIIPKAGKKVVEAEFEEKKVETAKAKKKPKAEKKPETEKNALKKEGNANLDDIARVLGVK